MTFKYFADTDTLYINLTDTPSTESQELSPNVTADYDANGQLVGLDIQHASKTVNLSKLEAHALPLTQTLIANAS